MATGTKKPLKVATVCVLGRTAKAAKDNVKRIGLLDAVQQRIQAERWKPSIILFPGGFFFYAEHHLGFRPDDERKELLSAENFSKACVRASKEAGALVVAGVDGKPWRRPGSSARDLDGGDQLAVAWSGDGLAGVGRKVWPTKGEGGRYATNVGGYVVYKPDFSTMSRLVKVPEHGNALLCACYDHFGITETRSNQKARSDAIRYVARGPGEHDVLNRWDDGPKLRSFIHPCSVSAAGIPRRTNGGGASGVRG